MSSAGTLGARRNTRLAGSSRPTPNRQKQRKTEEELHRAANANRKKAAFVGHQPDVIACLLESREQAGRALFSLDDSCGVLFLGSVFRGEHHRTHPLVRRESPLQEEEGLRPSLGPDRDQTEIRSRSDRDHPGVNPAAIGARPGHFPTRHMAATNVRADALGSAELQPRC